LVSRLRNLLRLALAVYLSMQFLRGVGSGKENVDAPDENIVIFDSQSKKNFLVLEKFDWNSIFRFGKLI